MSFIHSMVLLPRKAINKIDILTLQIYNKCIRIFLFYENKPTHSFQKCFLSALLHKMRRLIIRSVFSLMLGLMLPTWFLSMWISNTAATSMMVPIITAVASQMSELEPNKISRTVCCSLTCNAEMIALAVIIRDSLSLNRERRCEKQWF